MHRNIVRVHTLANRLSLKAFTIINLSGPAQINDPFILTFAFSSCKRVQNVKTLSHCILLTITNKQLVATKFPPMALYGW